MPKLTPCAACTELVVSGTCICPHCGDKACSAPRITGPALLLGLSVALTGCPVGQPKYGVPDTGDSGSPPTSREVPAMVDAIVAKPSESPTHD